MAEQTAGEVAPAQSWSWLRPFIPKRAQPFLRGLRKWMQPERRELEEPYRSVFTYTQASLTRQRNLVSIGQTLDREKIPGAIVECGVLDGGTAALMAWATDASRQVHLFDAWEGLPETTAEDGAEARKWTGEVVGSPTRVLAIMDKLGVKRERLSIHRGWFNETFPVAGEFAVALLHVDCDFYDPTKLCLEKWYPLLSPGGFMQFDDYESFQGCRMAVDQFLADHPALALNTVGTHGSAYVIRKPL